MHVDRGDGVALTRELVRIDSRNPSLVPGGPGEGAVARALCEILQSWGFNAELREVAPGRPNVVARVGDGKPGGATLMFNGHLDVVGVDGMVHDPWGRVVTDGRLYGRGSSDMKGGVAAMCAAAARAAPDLGDTEIVIAGVVDEEFESLGTRALVAQGVRADAAIVTEPTKLAIMPAHKGFVWIDVTTHGRAAHGSRWETGIDAIRHAGHLLVELEALDGQLLPRKNHPLLGRPSIHASLIEGGSGMSTYPDRCTVRLERRTIPGETVAQVRAEIDALCTRAGLRIADFRADVSVTLCQLPSDVSTDAPVVQALTRSLVAGGEAVRVDGMSAWTDAAILNEAGIPAICFGPGDIGLAHAAEEYIELSEIERATNVLAHLARTWSGTRGDAWRS